MTRFLTACLTAMFAVSCLAAPAFADPAARSTTIKRQVKSTKVTNTTRFVQTQVRVKRFENSRDKIGIDNTQKWECTETQNGFGGCECKGMLDCKGLLDSGNCSGKSWWEDTNDNSVGGCD